MTYHSILNEMKEAFFEKTGRDVDAFDEIAARLACVASELYSLYCESRYLLKQTVPQLAGGAYLDYHAALKGLTRKSASKAHGALTFSVSEAAAQDISVAQGCICSAAGQPYLQFITTEAGVIPAGETQCTVGAEACETGSRYNVPAGSVTVMVNPPLYVEEVTNAQAFSHGTEAENDTALRKRLTEACAVIPTGYSAAAIRELILRDEEILDCHVAVDNGEMTVALRTRSGAVSAATEAYVRNCAAVAQLTEMPVSVISATQQDYTLLIDAVCTSADLAETEADIRRAVQEYTESVGIGDAVSLQQLACAAAHLEDVAYAEAASPEAENGVIYAGHLRYPVPQQITVNCHA